MNFLQFFNIPGLIAAGLYYAFTHALGTQKGTAVFTQAAPVIVPAIETSLAPHLGSAGAALSQAASSQSPASGSQAAGQSATATATEGSNGSATHS